VNEELVVQVENARFTQTALRQGYDIREVDDFLDVVVAARGRGESLVGLVSGARFTTTRFRSGYAMREVDDFLAGLLKAG
jgi:DivIVA domain-containing protein